MDTRLPPEAYQCADNPVKPSGDDYGQKRIRRYIVDLHGVIRDCRGKLSALSPYHEKR